MKQIHTDYKYLSFKKIIHILVIILKAKTHKNRSNNRFFNNG